MSLVSTYVEADDGHMYRNPVIQDPEWFICFDDDDPPEIVIRQSSTLLPAEILTAAGIRFRLAGKLQRCGSRMFAGKFAPARNQFFRLLAPLPARLLKSKPVEKPEQVLQGVFYRWSKKGTK